MLMHSAHKHNRHSSERPVLSMRGITKSAKGRLGKDGKKNPARSYCVASICLVTALLVGTRLTSLVFFFFQRTEKKTIFYFFIAL